MRLNTSVFLVYVVYLLVSPIAVTHLVNFVDTHYGSFYTFSYGHLFLGGWFSANIAFWAWFQDTTKMQLDELKKKNSILSIQLETLKAKRPGSRL